MSDRKAPRPDLARSAGRAFRRLTSGSPRSSATRRAAPPRRRPFFRTLLDGAFWLVIVLIITWVIVNAIVYLRT